MAAKEEETGARKRADQALRRLEERVRHVQHLEPFRVSVRDDGRFRCGLDTPLSQLTAEEARAAADALEELADLVRRSAES